jgi:uncharacterized RDD family membrane protein YckC
VDVPVLWGLLLLVDLATTGLMNRTMRHAVLDPKDDLLQQIIFRYQVAYLAGSIALGWLYFAGAEACPRLQATPGKWLLRMQLVDRLGGRTALWRTTLRFLLKPLSAAALMLGFLMVAVNRRKRSLHDLLSGCYVVRR